MVTYLVVGRTIEERAHSVRIHFGTATMQF